MIRHDECPGCGAPLVWATLPGVDPDSGKRLPQRVAFDQGGAPHVRRCPDNPFTTKPRGLAVHLAREVAREMAAARG